MFTSEVFPVPSDTTMIVAGVITVITAVFFFVVNGWVALVMLKVLLSSLNIKKYKRKSSSLQKGLISNVPFAILYLNMVASECFICLAHVVWVAPALFLCV